jgi:hypothetical protein
MAETKKTRRTKKKSPMVRTLAELRARGMVPVIVEHWNSFAQIRQDLLGIIDVVAFDPTLEVITGVQVCGVDFAPHWRKITQERANEARLWLLCAGSLEIWGWRKLKSGWSPRIKAVELSDLELPENAV